MLKNQKSDQPKKGIKNIDELRKSHELPHHWQLRKEFLQIYAEDYELDRLICLSNVFVNVECMGLSYPDEVMKTIKQLGSKVKGLEYHRYQVSVEEEEPERPRKQPQGRRRYN